MPVPLVALLTDFGSADPYAGVMKGVLAARCPGVQTIDITHAVAPQRVAQGAYLLRVAYRYFPPHTVFLCVVDPGVGTARRGLAIQTPYGAFVGPDNGLFSLALDDIDRDGAPWSAVELRATTALSHTFHGRDLFAPAAAALACGEPLDALGPPVHDPIRLSPLRLERPTPDRLVGDVIHVDHFGNVITSLGPWTWQDTHVALADGLRVRVSSARVGVRNVQIEGIVRTYGEVEPGRLMALISSDGQLEIAVNGGRAAAQTGARPGDRVTLRFQP
ncbi:MAG: SAM-dependent chlorinase/fluorinase [Anaerolineae bacterium]|nr:SAM-dependent chlorinase/fluorinase [Anaerolineae bacterium]